MFENLKKELNIESHNYFGDSISNENQDYLDTFSNFNEKIGLPKHPHTGTSSSLIPYQMEIFNLFDEKKQNKFHIIKSRQIGVTEIILRILAFQSFHKYKGGKIRIITGTREKTASKLMQRFKELFRNVPQLIEEQKYVLRIKLVNGTEIEALPSNSDAIRGDTKINAIFIDEAAHYNLKDDSVVLDAIQPIVFTNKADIFLVSTPNGPRGFFYDIKYSKNDYTKLEYNYTSAINYIYSKEEIELELNRQDIDVEQEYCCNFTSGRNSVFGNDFVTGDHEISW